MIRAARVALVAPLMAFSFAAAPRAASIPILPDGPEFHVSASAGFQAVPAVTMLPSGEFHVFWAARGEPLGGASTDVIGQRLDRSGKRMGGEFIVNTWTASLQSDPEAASNPSGAFVVVWESLYQDGDSGGVFGQLFAPSGAPVGGEFQASTHTSLGQIEPVVDMDDRGGFVVAWSNGQEVYARRFDPAAAPIGAEFRVNSTTAHAQREPDVASDAEGGFVVVWQSDGGQDGDLAGIFAQAFDSSGAPVGGELLVNTMTISSQNRPSIDMAPTGEFVVAWDGSVEDLSYTTIFGRRFDREGLPVGAEFRAGWAPSAGGVAAEVSVRPNGESLAAWTGSDGLGRGIFARAFDAEGTAIGATVPLNVTVSFDQISPDVAGDGRGRFVVVWQGSYASGIFARILDRPKVRITRPRDGDPVDCNRPKLWRPLIVWEPSRFEEFKVQLSPDPLFGGPMSGMAASGWMAETTWTPPLGQWRKACREAIEAGGWSPVLHLRVTGRDLDLGEDDPDFEEPSETIMVTIGLDLLNPPLDPVQLRTGGRPVAPDRGFSPGVSDP